MQYRIPICYKEAQISYNPKMNAGETRRMHDWLNEIEYNERHKSRKKHKLPNNMKGQNDWADVTPNVQTSNETKNMSNTFNPSTDKSTEGPIL